ncbi:hypothetical protein A0J51_03275 [Gluconobacter japonicus]|nr:hypothetical protein A0J51_03275 [Gluconobacter japonicus]
MSPDPRPDDADYLAKPLLTGKPYLGRLEDVAMILKRLFTDCLSQLEREEEEDLGTVEQTERLNSLILPSARGFVGLDQENFTPMLPWNGKPLADHLLRDMPSEIFSEVNRNDPLQVITITLGYVVYQCVQEVRKFSEGLLDEDGLNEKVDQTIMLMTYEMTGLPILDERFL